MILYIKTFSETFPTCPGQKVVSMTHDEAD